MTLKPAQMVATSVVALSCYHSFAEMPSQQRLVIFTDNEENKIHFSDGTDWTTLEAFGAAYGEALKMTSLPKLRFHEYPADSILICIELKSGARQVKVSMPPETQFYVAMDIAAAAKKTGQLPMPKFISREAFLRATEEDSGRHPTPSRFDITPTSNFGVSTDLPSSNTKLPAGSPSDTKFTVPPIEDDSFGLDRGSPQDQPIEHKGLHKKDSLGSNGFHHSSRSRPDRKQQGPTGNLDPLDSDAPKAEELPSNPRNERP